MNRELILSKSITEGSVDFAPTPFAVRSARCEAFTVFHGTGSCIGERPVSLANNNRTQYDQRKD